MKNIELPVEQSYHGDLKIVAFAEREANTVYVTWWKNFAYVCARRSGGNVIMPNIRGYTSRNGDVNT